jgi:hypothetical protein
MHNAQQFLMGLVVPSNWGRSFCRTLADAVNVSAELSVGQMKFLKSRITAFTDTDSLLDRENGGTEILNLTIYINTCHK